MQRPLLRIGGSTGLDAFEIRVPFVAPDIEALFCTVCVVSTNGAAPKAVPVPKLGEYLFGAGNAVHAITLRNERIIDAREAVASVDVRVTIPTPESLAEIDRQFIQILAQDEVNIRQVDRFRSSTPLDSTSAPYAGALADYAIGIITKEQRPRAGATEPFASFSGKFKSARRELAEYQRPLASAVVALIDFNLNNFRPVELAQFPELRSAHRFFLSLTLGQSAERMKKPPLESAVAACPVDAVTAAIWNAIQEFPASIDTADDSPHLPATRKFLLSEYDLAKLRAVKASALLLLNKRSIARDHFRALRHDARFGSWADAHLEAPAIS